MYRQDKSVRELFESLRGSDKRFDLAFKKFKEEKRKQAGEGRNKLEKINFDHEAGSTLTRLL